MARKKMAQDAAPKVAEAEAPPHQPTAVSPAAALTPEQRQIAESREALKHPLSEGQKFFEAPDGYIIVGDADRPHVRDRRAGKSAWINPRR